jgi:hypothetical protein
MLVLVVVIVFNTFKLTHKKLTPLDVWMEVLVKPATGEGMDKSTPVHTQIQNIIIHFLPSPFPPIPNG